MKLDSANDYPAFILLDHPISIGELSPGTVVANPMSPLDAFSPQDQPGLRDLVKKHGFVFSVQNFDMNAVIERASNSSVRSWLENVRGKDVAVALSAAAVARRSLINHAQAVEIIIDHYRPEVVRLVKGKGKAYVIVGLMEFADGTITNNSAREATGSISVGADMVGIASVGASASIRRAERFNYEASYSEEKIFAIQYRILQYRRSSISGSRRIQLEGYMSKATSKISGATFM